MCSVSSVWVRVQVRARFRLGVQNRVRVRVGIL